MSFSFQNVSLHFPSVSNPDAIRHDKVCWLHRHSLISQIPCWFKLCFSRSMWVSKTANNSCCCWKTSKETWITITKIKLQITGISSVEQGSQPFSSLHSSTVCGVGFFCVFFLILHELTVVNSCFCCWYTKQFHFHVRSTFQWRNPPLPIHDFSHIILNETNAFLCCLTSICDNERCRLTCFFFFWN